MKREEINIRDPFVLTRNGQYYLYGTRGATCWGPADGFDVYVSRDLENWDGPFECFHNDGTFWADRNYWAPEVHEYHGKLYMLASFKREDLCRGTAILTADNPLGPFVPHSDGRVTPSNWECLDGTLYVSPDDKPYLVFAHEWVQVGDGEICAMPLSDDLSRAIGEPKLLFHASEAEWARLVHHRSSGRDGYVTDGRPCGGRRTARCCACGQVSLMRGIQRVLPSATTATLRGISRRWSRFSGATAATAWCSAHWMGSCT